MSTSSAFIAEKSFGLMRTLLNRATIIREGSSSTRVEGVGQMSTTSVATCVGNAQKDALGASTSANENNNN